MLFRDLPDNGRLSMKKIRSIEQSSEDLLGFSVGSRQEGEEEEEEGGEERAVDVGELEEEDVILGLELHVDCVSIVGKVQCILEECTCSARNQPYSLDICAGS